MLGLTILEADVYTVIVRYCETKSSAYRSRNTMEMRAVEEVTTSFWPMYISQTGSARESVDQNMDAVKSM